MNSKITISLPDRVKTVMRLLNDGGYESFAVGGCVRSILLNTVPNDWDICTNALPEQMKRCFSGLKTYDTGIKHGTITVEVDGDYFEVTTYRLDGKYSDNRHPDSVTFTSELTLDLSRRDLTINAMAYNDETGLVDPFNGIADLKARLIRCVGEPDKRFREDALRVMRALRFASTLGFELESKTARAVLDNADLLNNVAYERIRSELLRLLCGDNCEEILNTYRDVIAVFIPELKPCFDFDQRNKHHVYDVYRHIVHSVSLVENTPLLRMTMLLHDIAKPPCCTTDEYGVRHFKGHQLLGAQMAETILRRLRFSNSDIQACVTLIRYHDVRYSGSVSQVKRLLGEIGEERMRELLSVQRADTLSQSTYLREEKLSSIDTAKQQMEEIIRESSCFSLKQLEINGNDLINLGISKGREIGAILNVLLSEVLEDQLPNKKDALIRRAEELKEQY